MIGRANEKRAGSLGYQEKKGDRKKIHSFGF